MEKVKVARYISGKVPEYARGFDSDSDSYNSASEEEEYYQEPITERSPTKEEPQEKDAVHDRRLARLLQRSIPSTNTRFTVGVTHLVSVLMMPLDMIES